MRARLRITLLCLAGAAIALAGNRQKPVDLLRANVRVSVARLVLNEARPLRIALVGDMHGALSVGGGLRAVKRREGVDAVFLLGDNFDPCGVSSLSDPPWAAVRSLSSLDVPIFPVLGNHDYGDPHFRPMLVNCGGDPEAQIKASAIIPNWRFPARNYVVTTPQATFIFVDTTPIDLNLDGSLLGSLTSEQTYDWLRREIPRANGWRVVIGHHAAYGSSVPRWKDLPARTEMRRFGAFLQRNGVDLYVSGHQHHLELMRDAGGTEFVVSGAARSASPLTWTQPGHPATRFARSAAGFGMLDVSRDALTVTFVDASGNVISSRFTITHGVSGDGK